VPKPAKTQGRTMWLPATTSMASYFNDFTTKTAKTLMKLTVLEKLSVESDSQVNQQNQTEVLPATITMTLKRKAASSEQTKKTNVSSLFMCMLSDHAIALHFGPHSKSLGLHVKASISLPWVGEVPHLPGVPRFHVNRPLERSLPHWPQKKKSHFN